MRVREKLIHRQGRYILYDSSNVDCANAGTFKPDGELKAGEVCVKTVLPRTKIGYFSGFTQRPIKVDFIEQIYETRESNPFMDSSYIGKYLFYANSKKIIFIYQVIVKNQILPVAFRFMPRRLWSPTLEGYER